MARMAVNLDQLRNVMAEKSLSVSGLANALNIDTATVYRKMKANGESFTVGEMHKIVEVLNLSPESAGEIFLFANSQ